jgi:alkylation response protein AidB-like acyl-CoA dehydrogenase
MDIKETTEDIALRGQVRQWLRDQAPVAEPKTLEERREWHQRLHAAGFVGMTWPREFGGQGAGPMAQAIVGAEMAIANAPAPINLSGLEIAGPSLMQFGTEQQRARYLRPILAATELWCQLYSEPNAGSDLASLGTTARRDGNVYIVNGQKVWISEGPWADYGVLLARTDRNAPRHKGISCLIVDMRSRGVEVRPLRQITGSSHFSEVFLSDVCVPCENLIGAENDGWKVAMAALAFERGGNSLARITRYQMAFRKLVKTLSKLNMDGRPMIADHGIRHRLGIAWAEIEVQRITALRLLSLAECGEDLGGLPSSHKLSYSEFERRFTDMAAEMLGPWARLVDGEQMSELLVGTSSAEPGTWAHATLWSRAVTIFAGTSEIQRNIIADRVLRLPREPRAV